MSRLIDDDALRLALQPFAFDGCEACHIIRTLTDSMLDAGDDIKEQTLAEGVAKLQLHRLLEGLVPIEAVLNIIARMRDR
jgi:hypothetical protein